MSVPRLGSLPSRLTWMTEASRTQRNVKARRTQDLRVPPGQRVTEQPAV